MWLQKAVKMYITRAGEDEPSIWTSAVYLPSLPCFVSGLVVRRDGMVDAASVSEPQTYQNDVCTFELVVLPEAPIAEWLRRLSGIERPD